MCVSRRISFSCRCRIEILSNYLNEIKEKALIAISRGIFPRQFVSKINFANIPNKLIDIMKRRADGAVREDQ